MFRPISTNQSRFMGTGIHEVKLGMVVQPGWFELDGEGTEEEILDSGSTVSVMKDRSKVEDIQK